jgi:membrane protease YdiL (CAAX protease family)
MDDMDLASQPHQENTEPELNGVPPIHAIFRFLIAAAVTWLVNWAAATSAFGVFGNHLLFADLAYRVVGAALLIGIYALLLSLLDHREGNRLAGQGLPLNRLGWRQFLAGLAFGMLLIAICVALVATFGHYQTRVTITAHTLKLGAEVLSLLFAGALLEEVMFRGYPFQRLVEAVGPVWAVTVASALFAAAHLGNPNASGVLSWAFFNTIAIGVLLAIVYLRTRTLWLPFGIHFGWNFALGFVFGLPVSGLSDFSVLVHGSIRGPQWLTGGAYGLENSGAAAFLLGLSLLVALRGWRAWAKKYAPDSRGVVGTLV